VLLKHLWRRGEAATTPVGLVPLGTGNDFARGVGIPLDHIEAARLVRTGRPRPVDLIVDDSGGVVVNAVHVGAGADAAVKARPLKRRLRRRLRDGSVARVIAHLGKGEPVPEPVWIPEWGAAEARVRRATGALLDEILADLGGPQQVAAYDNGMTLLGAWHRRSAPRR
jgi:hypothetical protein